jgi:hypothetical protein
MLNEGKWQNENDTMECDNDGSFVSNDVHRFPSVLWPLPQSHMQSFSQDNTLVQLASK